MLLASASIVKLQNSQSQFSQCPEHCTDIWTVLINQLFISSCFTRYQNLFCGEGLSPSGLKRLVRKGSALHIFTEIAYFCSQRKLPAVGLNVRQSPSGLNIAHMGAFFFRESWKVGPCLIRPRTLWILSPRNQRCNILCSVNTLMMIQTIKFGWLECLIAFWSAGRMKITPKDEHRSQSTTIQDPTQGKC